MSRFKEEIQRIRDSARFEPINILVWGPGKPSGSAHPDKHKAYQKRLKIKSHLKEIFQRAEVFFSEDLIDQTLTGQGILQAQAIHAKIAHLILVLDLGRGVDLELDHFIPTYPWFREKVYVFLPDRYVPPKGLVEEVFNKLETNRIIGFNEQEFNECTLVTFKVVEVADTIAMDHFISR